MIEESKYYGASMHGIKAGSIGIINNESWDTSMWLKFARNIGDIKVEYIEPGEYHQLQGPLELYIRAYRKGIGKWIPLAEFNEAILRKINFDDKYAELEQQLKELKDSIE